jgi:hypothetical protein
MYPGNDEDVAIITHPRTSSRSYSVAEPATFCLILGGTKPDYLARLRGKETQMSQALFLGQLIHGKVVHIVTDGGACANPGNAGWEFLMRQNKHFTYNYGHSGFATNNVMEIRAVIEAIRLLPKGSYVWVSTGSAYVKLGVTGWLNDWMNRG